MTALERTRATLLTVVSLLLPASAFAQDPGIEAPSAYQQELDANDPDSSFTNEADAVDAQAEAIEATGTATGLSQRAADRVEEIVVTARKRAELLEDTPLSVTALSPTTLRQAGVVRINEVQNLVPNTTFRTSVTNPQIRIRGVGSSAAGAAFDPGVGLYLDGIFIPRSRTAVLDIVDVQQIEVLRGPQGTLFGKNTVGGAVSVTTVKPQMDPEAFVFLRPGNLGSLTTRAMLNMPIGSGWLEDKLAVRLAFGSGTSGGYVYNSFRDEYLSNLDNQTFIGAARFLPTDSLTIDVFGSYGALSTGNIGGQCVFVQDGPLTGLVPGFPQACRETKPFETTAQLDQLISTKDWAAWGIARYELGDLAVLEDVSFRSLTSWREGRSRFRTDLDATRINVINLQQAGGSDPSGDDLINGEPGTAQQIQQEVQMNAAAWDGRINLVTGLFTFWEKSGGGTTVVVAPLNSAANSNIKNDNFTWALYAQGTADVTDWLSLTAGIRYTSDKKGVDQFNSSAIDPEAPSGGGADEKTFTSWTPMASVALLAPDDWLGDAPIDHLMTYFTYSRGFKGGGFNAAVQATVDAGVVPLPFGPETLDNFELGVKAIVFDQRLTMNLALFRANYDDIQQTSQRVIVDEDGMPVTQRLTLNAAKATVQGVEVELQSRPLPGMFVMGSLGYLDARYDSFPNALSDLDGTTIDRSGQTFNQTPRWQTFLAVQQSFPISPGGEMAPWLDGFITPRVQWAFRSRQHTLGPELGAAVQRGYHLLGARLSYDFLDDRAQIALFANNLLDEEYLSDAFSVTATYGFVTRWYQPPRTFGAELSYRFD
jgi:iron complex outermembrane receptor protein